MNKLMKLFGAMLIIVVASQGAWAQNPPLVNYQAVLTSPATGEPVPDATYAVVFSIYNIPTGGSAIWTETQSVQTQNGAFDALLGSVTPLSASVFTGPSRFLGVKVGTDAEMTPRKRLASSPYVIRGNSLDDAYNQGGPGAGRAIRTDSGPVNITGAGGLTVNGKVGIGTEAPREKFEIRSEKDFSADVLLNENDKFGWRLRNNGGDNDFRITSTTDFSTYTNRFAIRKNGNVGIGTGEPTENLEIRSEGGVSSSLLLSQGNKSGWRFRSSDLDNDLRIASTNDFTTYETRLSIGKNGRVGIGVVNPEAKLHVDGTTRTNVLEITGGADLAEPFVVDKAHDIQAGMVVAIAPDKPGQLQLAHKAYDRTVAGIVSGANGVNPGLTMTQEGSIADGSLPVALTGRVYCWADASSGAIAPGDLLTTSDTPGHAMKVTNHERAQGAVIGKAMSSLHEGTGFVLVLISLQ